MKSVCAKQKKRHLNRHSMAIQYVCHISAHLDQTTTVNSESACQAPWPHLTSDTDTFWKPLRWATKALSIRNHTKDPALQQLQGERDKRRRGGKQPWEHNCPPIQSDWIHNVLTGCIAACHGSALYVFLVLSGQERGERRADQRGTSVPASSALPWISHSALSV